MVKQLLFVLFCMGALPSCNYNTTKGGAGSMNNATKITTDTMITFELIQKSPLSSCVHCHDSYSKKQAIVADMSSILSEVNTDEMPKPGNGFPALTACQKEILKKWFDLGAPDESTFAVKDLSGCENITSTPSQPPVVTPPVVVEPPTPSTDIITYDLIKTDTAAVCLKCHSAGGLEPELTSQQAFLDNKADIISDIRTNRMPMKFPALSDCAKATLEQWLNEGAPDKSTTSVSSLPECAKN